MMSVYGNHDENDQQNSKENSKKFSQHILFRNSEPTKIAGGWVKSSKINCRNQSEERVRPKIDGWRRAVREDIKAIQELQSLTGCAADLLYRKKNLVELIENSYFTVVQFDTKGDLISFTAYDSYPNLPFKPFWMDWLSVNYKIDGINPGNVFFVHYMVWVPEHEDEFLGLLLKTSFAEFIHVKQIIIIQPPKTDIPQFYKNYFIPVWPVGWEELKTNSIQLLRICLRSSIIHPLYIRTAFEEDFDLIFHVVRGSMKKSIDESLSLLNPYEFIFQKDKKTLICEINGQLAGVMILNLKIDLDILNEGFELEPFNGFRKKNLHSEISESELPIKEIKTCDSDPMLMSKNLLLSLNWSLNQSESVTSRNGSLTSLTDNFSFCQFPSLFDLRKINETDQTTINEEKIKVTPQPTSEINVTIRPSKSTIPHFYPPKFSGQSNAFLVDFFAIDSNRIDEKLSFLDFLEAAFKTIPDKEYCIILSPTDVLQYNILDLFVRVPPKLLSSFKQELYLCHRNSFSFVSMSVRSTEDKDLMGIQRFLKNVNDGETVFQDILECFEENNGRKSFVFTFENTIIGVSLINSQDYSEHFYTYFEIPDSKLSWVCGSRNKSVIKHLVISPAYNNHTRFFVLDLMRLMDVNCLFYVNTFCKTPKNLLTVLGEFVPVKPKKKVELKGTSIFYEKENVEYYGGVSLYILNPRLCGFRRVHLNLVLVVVGASRTSISFLESLIFGPKNFYCNFNNIICVSPRGLDLEDVEENIRSFMFADEDDVSRNYISMLSLNTHVHCLHGHMTQINRSEKFIVINNKSTVRYDYLVLTCGLQYLTPIPEAHVKVKPKQNYKSSLRRFLRKSEKEIDHSQPKLHNMFLINSNKDAEYAINSVQFLMEKMKLEGRKIIVYGHDLNVFLTINTLLKMGIPGEFIAFVEPFPTKSERVTLFNDPHVDQTAIELVKNCNVSYYSEYFLHDWSVSSEDYITAIKFHSKNKKLVIPCLAFFPFVKKFVSDVTFNACRDAGLVYDGRLVINHNFKTNDNYIYAAGPFTKYARRYYADEYSHQYYNSREVGQKLATILIGKLNPMVEDETEETSELVPRLEQPVFYYCQLPGELNLFSLRKPGKELDRETECNIKNYGEVLTTGVGEGKNTFKYFRLHLNPEGFVESITCFSKNEIEYLNLCRLYGLHEKILNNLLFHFDLTNIPDLLEYFCQPWATAIYHDNFQYLRQRNYEAFLQKLGDDKTFYEKVVEALEEVNWTTLRESTLKQLELTYRYSKVNNDIKNNLIAFLEQYKKDLKNYAIPSEVEKLREKRRLV